MNDEIKEILGKLEIVARKHTIEVCDDGSKIETMPASIVHELRLNNWSAKLLLDYITNLQQELETRQYDINNLTYQLAKEKSRCEKANNFIEENWISYKDSKDFKEFDEVLEVFIKEINELYNILNGKE